MSQAYALITGAGGGIGRAVAIRLSNMGYHVILTSRNKTALEETAQLCVADKTTIIAANLLDKKDVEHLAETVLSIQTLSVIFYSHGFHQRGRFLDTSMSDIENNIQLYLQSILYLDQKLLPLIIETQTNNILKSKAIIYMGSVSSTLAMANNGAYSMCKHALKAHADCLFEEIRETGIKVGSLFPGYINSRQHTHDHLDANKMIQIEDIVLAVEFMLRMGPATCVTGIHLRPQFTPKL